MLRLARVCKRFDDSLAIDSVDLDLERGRTVALIGASGSGKSTLLRLMNGILEPDEGAILLDDQPVEPARDVEFRRRMGYVIQEGGLFPHLTVLQNATLQARFLGWDSRRIAARVHELLELTHLSRDLLGRYPLELSGGQRQRVSLVRALVLDPEFLMLDEPLGALDPMIRSDLQRELRSIFRELGKTVVLVTHDLLEARFLAKRIVLLDRGRVVQDGVFDDLVERPANEFVTRFVSAQRGMAVADEKGEA